MTGEELKERRRLLGLTQKALGLLCGYSEATAERIVQHWEHGDRQVPIDKVRILAEVLQVSIDTLIP